METDNNLTVARVGELLDYDPLTGIFTRRYTGPLNSRFAGLPAGSLTPAGYIRISVDNVSRLAHRLAWLCVYGRWPALQIDHINGNRTDNRIANLREATHAENGQNKHGPSKANKAGLLGVSYFKRTGRWAACIRIDGRTIGLGTYRTKEEASAAYLAAKKEIHTFWVDTR